MRILLPLLSALLSTLLLAGCNADHTPAPTAQAPATPAPAKEIAPPAADVITRFACDPDTVVDILTDDRAQVSLPDGQQVGLGKVANSDPPVYTGANLFFTISGDQAHLSQDSGRDLACKKQ